MADAPAPPWTYPCEHPGCDYAIRVYARGGCGRDQGAGYEAAVMMQEHVALRHASAALIPEPGEATE